MTVYQFQPEEQSLYQLGRVEQIMGQTPGVQFNYQTGTVSHRGITSSAYSAKTFVDGICFSPIVAGTSFSVQSILFQTGNTVETIQGPSALVFGGNSFCGAVKTIIEPPKDTGTHSQIRSYSGIGSNGYLSNTDNIDISGRYNKWRFRSGMAYSTLSDNWHSSPIDDSLNTDQKSWLYYGKAGVTVSRSTTAEAGLYLAETNHRSAIYNPVPSYSNAQKAAKIQIDHRVDSVHSVQFQGMYRSDNQQAENTPSTPTFATNSVTAWQTGASLLWFIDNPAINNYTVIGAGYTRTDSHAETDSAGFEISQNINEERSSEGHVRIQTQQKFYQDKCVATISLRRDFHSEFVAPLTMRHSLQYRYSDHLNLTYTYSESYREPTIFEREINPELLPERISQQAFLVWWQKGAVRARTTIYYSMLNELVGPVTDTIQLEKKNVYPLMNRKERNLWGAEAEISASLNQQTGTVWADATQAKNMALIVPFRTGFRFHTKTTDHTAIAFVNHYSAPTKNEKQNYSKPYFCSDVVFHLVNLQALKLLHIDGSIAVRNLFNNKVPENYFYTSQLSTIHYVPRSIWVSLGLRL